MENYFDVPKILGGIESDALKLLVPAPTSIDWQMIGLTTEFVVD